MRLIHYLFIIVIALSLVGCGGKKEEKKVIIRPVKSMIVGAPEEVVIRNFPGRVIASTEADLAFQVPGVLMELPVQDGDQVKKGQLLARLDPEKYTNRAREEEAKYIRSRAEYARAQELIKNDYISRSDYDKKRSEYLIAKANLSTAEKDLRDTHLYAPFSGVVARRFVENYENVNAKQVVLRLQDLAYIDVEINVPENIVINLKEGRTIPPTVVFEAAPQREFSLKYKKHSAEADPETQTYRIVLTMPAPKDLNILPGMTATVKAAIPDFKSAVAEFYVIPSSAVFVDEKNQPSVWVIDPNTMKVKRVDVSVSRLSGDDMRVLKGLKQGDRIVTAGVHYLHEGEQVKLLKPKTEKKAT